MLRSENDFRDRLAALRADPSTPLEQIAAEAKRSGLTLRTDRKGGFAEVPDACNPTVQRIRAAIIARGRRA